MPPKETGHLTQVERDYVAEYDRAINLMIAVEDALDDQPVPSQRGRLVDEDDVAGLKKLNELLEQAKTAIGG